MRDNNLKTQGGQGYSTDKRKKEKPPIYSFFSLSFVLCTPQEEQRWVFEPPYKREREKQQKRILEKKQ
ncbi:hypothetical protein RJT34_16231 [Clitoria ternatea]|uniref:Uncharacterized protein n=1 Tax=Clitoria ternatea TaxID=43366 RepID=A0AAN9J6T6_CLITE